MEQVNSLKTGKKFKKTEIGEIPVDWEVMQIHDLCTLGRGRVISQNEIDNNSGQYPVFSSQSKDKGVMGYINSYDFDGEYVTWTTDGAYAGTVFYRGGKFNCTNVCGTLKSRVEFIDMWYLCYALNKLTKRHVVLCGNPKLMNNVMAQIKVQIPPLPEQKKIAEILTTVDEAIEKSDEIIEKTKELKKGLMQELLTRGIGHKKFKRTKIGEIPEEWDIKPISKTCNINPPKREINSLANVKEVSFLPMEFVKEDGEGIMQMEIREISEVLKGYTYFRENDILFSKITPCMENGKIAIASNLRNGIGFGSTEFHVLRPNIKLLLPETLFYWISRNPFRDAAKNFFTGTAGQQRVQKGFFDVVKIPLPPLPEQRKIAKILSSVDEEIRREVDNKKKLETIKKGLMQVLLTGKKRIKV